MKASSCDRHGVVVCVVPQRPMDSVSPFGGIKETNCLTHILLLLAHTYFSVFCILLKALFSCLQNSKILQDSPSHEMFKCMHEVLNIAKQNN